jgi:hypothetical protein
MLVAALGEFLSQRLEQFTEGAIQGQDGLGIVLLGGHPHQGDHFINRPEEVGGSAPAGLGPGRGRAGH